MIKKSFIAHVMRLVLFNSLYFIIINEQLKSNYIGMVYKNKYVYIIHPIINFVQLQKKKLGSYSKIIVKSDKKLTWEFGLNT